MEHGVRAPPHAECLAIHGSDHTIVPGMGHTLSAAMVEPLADAILTHTTTAEATEKPSPAS